MDIRCEILLLKLGTWSMSKKYGIESGEKLRHFLDMSDYLLSSSYHMEVRDRGCEMARIISTGILRVGECMSESELEADGCVTLLRHTPPLSFVCRI